VRQATSLCWCSGRLCPRMTPEQPHPSDAEGLEPGWDLPRGRHRLPREIVVRHQRDRLIAGVAAAIAEHGYPRLSVERVIEVAGVSRTTFYAHFSNKGEAVLRAHDLIFERFLGLIVRACNAKHEWPLKVKAAIEATLDFAVEEPAQAQLLTLDALAANAEVAGRVLDSSDHLAALLSAGRRYSLNTPQLPDLTEKALVGAITAIIASRLMSREPERLPELKPQLVELTLTPYLGAREAKAVALGHPGLHFLDLGRDGEGRNCVD
jgi:AcrR family transcriptional regulator